MESKNKRLAAVAIIALAVAGWLLFGSTGQQSVSESGDGATGGEGTAMVQVKVPGSLSSEAQIGKLGFDAKCAQCHGENAAGRDGAGPPLIHKIYEPSHHGDAAFLLAAQNGVRAHHWRFGNMPPVDGVTRADVVTITTYVRELQRANGIN